MIFNLVTLDTGNPFYAGILDINIGNDDSTSFLGVFWGKGAMLCVYLFWREFCIWEA